VLIKDISDIVDFEILNREFDTLDYVKNLSNEISDNKTFFDRKSLKSIKNTLSKECHNFLVTAYKVREFEELKVTNSWGNITKTGESHHAHIHPFSVVSGVIYLDNNPSNLNLNLEVFVPQTPYFMYRETCFTPLYEWVNRKETNNLQNHLVLFLSNTKHHVTENKEDLDRRSISFNSFWHGHVGGNDPLASMYF
jgi:uncharacterized protein (TIGR02466 family)